VTNFLKNSLGYVGSDPASDSADLDTNGLAWETIIEEWRGSISYEAIAEAVRLSRQALLEHINEYALEPTAA
jgi:hypothetical protein